MSLRSILLSVAIAMSSVAPPFIANAAGKGKPSTPTAPVVGVVYPANSAEGCTGRKKCVVQSWGVDLNQNTGYQWSTVVGAGNFAELYVTTASASGTRSMSLWVNDTLVTVLMINKKDAKRPKGNEFGPFHVMLSPGNNNTVELRDTESSSELDAIAIRVVLLEQTDTDGDGVEDNLDLCPQTPAGTEVDANGCELILDEDNDGVRDDVDQCPLTPAGMTVDENGCEVIFGDTDADGFTDNVDLCIDTVGPFFTRGCPADFYDQDNDGVLNIVDRCPITPPGIEINSEGCGAAELTSDTDNDGVVDYLDACPNTQEIVDAAGCSAAQLNDDDNDGIRNAYDLCPNQIGFAKRNGCPLQLGTGDADMDGIADSVDLCPVTPEEWRNFFLVDASGCVFSDPNGPFEDLDLDGVANFTDSCPDTQDRSFVDYFGCSYAQFDTDFDGIANYSDYCVNSVRFEPVDGYGCGDGQIPDMDRDGVADNLDLCPATPYGYAVDDQGCSDDADFDGLSNDRERELGTDFLNSDTDADGLSDGYEVDTYGTNPLLADTDQGGVNDGQEASFGLDPFNPNDDSFLDSDYDGLRDLQEADYGTDPHNSDSDFDGLGDGQEVQEYFTNPLIADTDGGGAFDGSEVSAGLNPLDPLDDGSIDSDRDGLTDLEEIELGTQPYYNDSDFDSLSDGDEVKIYGTDPLQADTDQGGITDGYEVSTGLNPLDASDDLLFDSDQDGLNNQQEHELGTDPFNSDSDYDYLGDGDEINLHNTNPLVSDTDGGGFSDGAEVSVGLNPLDPTDDQLFDSDLDGLPDLEEAILGTYSWNPDSDYDGLSDGDEVKVHGTNPLLVDSDNGGVSDGQEINLGLNPLDASDDLSSDSDFDGLTDGEETSLGTSAWNPDSDYDGISDGDEVKIHGTNPLLSDTDGGGESDGQEINRSNDPLDPADDALQFPFVLQDGSGFTWDIQPDGSINDGTNDAFDSAFYLHVNGERIGSDHSARSSNGREIIFTSEQIPALKVTRRVYVPQEIGAARFIESFSNTGDSFVNISVSRAGNLGSDSATKVLLTGSGDAILDPRDSFVISDDSDGQPSGDPVITNLIQGATPEALALRPNTVSLYNDGFQTDYRISLRPGETVSLVSLVLQRESLMQSEMDISILQQLSHPIWQGINPVEALNIVNFFAQVDTDGDGLFDEQEIFFGTDPNNPDTGGDGFGDRESVLLAFYPELAGDSDADGIMDFLDRCLHAGDVEVDATGCLIAPTTDEDSDGVLDGQDFCPFTPIGTEVDSSGCERIDSDYDGLNDEREAEIGTDPRNSDTDADGLSDGQEVRDFNTNPLLNDTDGGGVADGQEIFNNLNPLDPIDDLLFDSDHDGLNDAQELEFGTDRFNGDSDFDGLSDGREVNEYTTNPLLNDTDGGGASDGNEVSRGLNPLDATDDLLLDSDYDSLTDAEELALGTDPFYPDSDFDLLNDGAEIKIHNTDPLLSDTDGGGIGDGDEVLRGLDPLDFTDDILFDWDADGLTDREENELGTNPFFYDTDFDSASDGDEVKIYKTDPLNYDTDAGGTRDGIEIAQGLNPLDPADDLFMDTDLDGLTDAEELALGTSINNPDSDYDEISDGNEVKVHLTNPLSTDTDGGGSTDGLEIAQGLNPLDPGDDQLVDSDLDGLNDTDENSRGTDPYNPDSDADGLLDGDEVNVHGTDPLLRDTDGGNTGDGHEIAQGTNPLDPGDDVLLLPIVLRDGADFQWDIQPDGSIGDGTNNAFDGGLLLLINNQSVFYERVLQSEDKREIILQTQKYPQLKVERRVRVPRDLAVARFIDSVTNTGSQALTLTIQIRTRLGSGSATQILGTGNGDMAFDNSDSFLITQDHQNAEYYQQPVVTQVFQGGYPDQVRLKPSESVLDNDFVQMARSVILRPGETIRLVTLGLQRHNLEDSQAAVHEMRQPHHPIWSDISSQDLLKIANLFAEIDSDMDGLLDEQELILGTDPMNVDSDFDGRNDRESILFDADPNLAGDSDFDGITDFRDMCIQAGDIDVGEDGCLIITDTDSDGDGVSDSFDACADTETGEEVFPNGCPTTALQILSAQTIEVSLSAGAAPFFSINMEQLTYSATEGALVSLDIFDPYFFNLSGPGASIDVIALNAGQTEYQVPVFLTDSFGNQSPTFFVTVRVNYLE